MTWMARASVESPVKSFHSESYPTLPIQLSACHRLLTIILSKMEHQLQTLHTYIQPYCPRGRQNHLSTLQLLHYVCKAAGQLSLSEIHQCHYFKEMYFLIKPSSEETVKVQRQQLKQHGQVIGVNGGRGLVAALNCNIIHTIEMS